MKGKRNINWEDFYSTFFLNEHPSVNLALPPVGWHNTVLQAAQKTTVDAWEKTVVI